MRRVGWLILGLVVLNVALLLVGAGRAKHEVPSQRLGVGLVFDVGGIGDKSFNDAAYRGLLAAERSYDVETRFIEPGDGADRESAIRELAATRSDLVIGVGFVFTDDLRKAAATFPRTRFLVIDYSVIPGQSPPPANLLGVRFREQEGAFLVGALAALVSKTHTLGFVGGMQIPLIRRFEVGYRAGAHYVCPDCRVLSGYAGVTPKAFTDPGKGKELALAQYRAGADVIFHASGQTGTGVFQAAREQNGDASMKWVIGVDSDQYHEAPCCVLTSMTKGVDVAVVDAVRQVVEGQFHGGVVELGLAQNGVDYIFDHRNQARIPRAVRERVESLRAAIIAGTIEVPWQ